jgi:hypothetical protein
MSSVSLMHLMHLNVDFFSRTVILPRSIPNELYLHKVSVRSVQAFLFLQSLRLMSTQSSSGRDARCFNCVIWNSSNHALRFCVSAASLCPVHTSAVFSVNSLYGSRGSLFHSPTPLTLVLKSNLSQFSTVLIFIIYRVAPNRLTHFKWSYIIHGNRGK